MPNPIYHLDRKADRRYHLRLADSEGHALFVAGNYNSRHACEAALQAIRDNSQIEARFDRSETDGHRFCFHLTTEDGIVIGTSPLYDTVQQREQALAVVRTYGATAPVEESDEAAT